MLFHHVSLLYLKFYQFFQMNANVTEINPTYWLKQEPLKMCL